MLRTPGVTGPSADMAPRADTLRAGADWAGTPCCRCPTTARSWLSTARSWLSTARSWLSTARSWLRFGSGEGCAVWEAVLPNPVPELRRPCPRSRALAWSWRRQPRHEGRYPIAGGDNSPPVRASHGHFLRAVAFADLFAASIAPAVDFRDDESLQVQARHFRSRPDAFYLAVWACDQGRIAPVRVPALALSPAPSLSRRTGKGAASAPAPTPHHAHGPKRMTNELGSKPSECVGPAHAQAPPVGWARAA
jgi:hypothetical protein